MKTGKRNRPADFGSLTDQIPTERLSPTFERGGAATVDVDAGDGFPAPAASSRLDRGLSERSQRSAATRSGQRVGERNGRSDDDFQVPSAWPVYFAAFVVSVLWVCGPIAFAVGYRRDVVPFHNDLFAMAVFALLALGPAAFVWIAAYFVRQGQRLGAETRRAQALADELTTPALVAAARAGDVIFAVRDEITRAGEAAEEARETLLALRDALAAETEHLVDAAASSVRTAQGLASTLGLERTEMVVLAQTLDTQATRVSDAITQQARMVAEASDLAETQLREAEASLASRAADLAAAATETGDVARIVGEDLNRHVARLESAGLGVAEQIRNVEGSLGAQRTALAALAESLRSEHDGFAVQAEVHAAQLSEFISQTRLSASEMADRAVTSGEALRTMVAEAADQFRGLTESLEGERDEFGRHAALAAGQMSEATAQERERLESQTRAAIEALSNAAEETRAAAAAHAEAARHHVDQLSEMAFSASQNANQAFEARLDEARQLIETSAEIIDQAGAVTARKLEDGATAARSTLDELQRMLGDVETRSATMPAAAREQAEQVRAAVAGSMEELLIQARRTAAETQAIDEAFQGRVRRNYEMLSEAVRLMGSVAAAGGLPPMSPVEPITRAPELAVEPQAPPPTPATAPTPPEPPAVAPAAPQAELAPAADSEFDQPAAAGDKPATTEPNGGLRPRLRLTPTSTDEAFPSIFETAAAKPQEDAPDTEGWTWKDLLSSIDEAEGSDPAKLQEALAREVLEMGIDTETLLPSVKLDEVAAVIQARDADGARQVVRAIAPAANRRLTRRMFADEKLKRQALTYIGRFKASLTDAVESDGAGAEVARLLKTDAGRIYLVLDAAAGDIV